MGGDLQHLRNLGDRISISIPADLDGYTGRECPECEGYFKITFGTGLKGTELPCHCPYCGYTGDPDRFWTKQQIEYAESIAMRQITNALHRDLKAMEFEIKPTGILGIGISMKVNEGPLPAIKHYREKQLETSVLCDHCTLKYMIYGVFAFCPDCRAHNSLQILTKNLELAEKQVDLASQVQAELSDHLIADALENSVASFDGFGREVCRVNAAKATDSSRAEKVSFQNLEGARTNIQLLFAKDFAQNIVVDDWTFINRCAQKRHLLAHNMGVIDQHYLAKTGDTTAIEGRKVRISGDEVKRLAVCLRRLGQELVAVL